MMSRLDRLPQLYEEALGNLLHIADVHFLEGQFDAALRVLRATEQIANAPEVAASDHARVLIDLGIVLAEQASFTTGEFTEALDVLDRAVQTAEASGSQHVLAEALNAAGKAHYRHTMMAGTNNFEQAAALFRRALVVGEASGYQETVCVALLNQGFVAERQQRYDEAVALFERVRTLAEQHDYYEEELAEAWRHLGFAHWRAEEYTEAQRCFERSLALWEKAGNKLALPFAHLSLGETFALQGDANRALQQYEAAYELADQMNNQRAALQTAFGIGEVHEQQGDIPTARRWYEQARTQADVIRFVPGVALCDEKLQQIQADEDIRRADS